MRLVMAGRVSRPMLATLGLEQADVVATPPRFEDAFVDLLGGGPKGELAAGRGRRQSTRRPTKSSSRLAA